MDSCKTGKKTRISEIRACLNLEPTKPQVKITVAQRMLEKFGKDIFKCPCCENGRLMLIKTIRPYKDYKINVDTRNKASPELN
jgi:hypothetical protein